MNKLIKPDTLIKPDDFMKPSEFKSKERIGIYMSSWVRDRMKPIKNKSKFIEQCIIAATGWAKEQE